jgi:UDP-N-acetylenolpyruvoylglucosamine reductase
VRFVPSVAKIHEAAGAVLDDGDLVLSLGAGNIHEAGRRLATDLETRARLLETMGPGRIKLYEPLSKHTTMRVGGPAQFWAEPETEEGFADLVRFCFDESIPLMVMGRGSNLLVLDGGIPGVVVHLARGEFQRHSVDGMEVTAGVGVKFKQLSALARSSGIAGFEWMEGIPGNLGGGLRMNAGAMGVETFDQVVRVRFCDQDGNIFTKTPAEMEVHYRNVPTLRRNFALSAVLRGEPGDSASIDALMAASMEKRRSTQPVAASAGCIFKNPAGIPAGRLIEELGLKGRKSGAARISEIHGNFIVNEGGASAADVLALIEEVKAAALASRGIQLETEVQITGIEP